MQTPQETSVQLVGYHVQSADGDPVGAVAAVQEAGLHLHRMPGYPGHRGYVPVDCVLAVDRATNTVVVVDGVSPAWAMLTPSPDRADARLCEDWWADLLGGLGMFEAEGRGNEPFLHPGQS